jgi:hypothetical protein
MRSANSVRSVVVTISAWSEETDPVMRARVRVAVDGQRALSPLVVRGLDDVCGEVGKILRGFFATGTKRSGHRRGAKRP